MWERENLPTLEDNRERFQRQQLRRSRNDPPITEIWSGKALNDLLLDAQKIVSNTAPGGSTPLDPDLLAKINVTSGKSGGNIGLLKGGKVTWPLLLRRKVFVRERDTLNQLVNRAVQQADQGEIDAEVLEELIVQVSNLQKRLGTAAREAADAATWTPSMYIDARNFLSQFDDALRVLQQPDAAKYLSGWYSAKGRTVAELVRNMKENGLRFAPATAGGETAYTALHRAMADFSSAAGEPVKGKP